jgi:hypothetical protein
VSAVLSLELGVLSGLSLSWRYILCCLKPVVCRSALCSGVHIALYDHSCAL